ncbi:MAG: DUF721 domain-containing protein [Bacteroidota bacterium]
MMKEQNDKTLKDVLKNFVDQKKFKPKLHQLKLEQVWGELMGPSIAGYTRRLYLRGSKLFITIDSAPLKQELSYGKAKILSILNEKLGEDYIEEVIIR